LEPNGLRGGVVYQDGQFDDARLAIALVRTVDDHGGSALNRVGVEGFVKGPGGRVAGLYARDAETGEAFTISARAVVNATGVFADEVRRFDEPGARPLMSPSRGAHLVLDRRFLPGETAILVPRTDDGRVIFAIPWNGRVVVGTTDTPVDRTSDEPGASRGEIDFLLNHAGRYLATDPTPADVLSVFAGLRPLLAAGRDGSKSTRTASLSRGHAVVVSASGLVTITGGKWTTYRRMAEDAVGRAAGVAGLPVRPCVTADLRLHGWAAGPVDGSFAAYGADAPDLETLLCERPELGGLLNPGLPYREVEVVWAAREEAARTVEDVLSRRTRSLLLDARASIQAAPRVAEILAAELGRDEAWQAGQVEAFRAVAAGYVIAA
jgi:glycerol-3-phosphate dehydrogenase